MKIHRKLELQRKIHQEILPKTETAYTQELAPEVNESDSLQSNSISFNNNIKKPIQIIIEDQKKIVRVKLEEKFNPPKKDYYNLKPVTPGPTDQNSTKNILCRKQNSFSSNQSVNYQIIDKNQFFVRQSNQSVVNSRMSKFGEHYQTKITSHKQQEIDSELMGMLTNEDKSNQCFAQNNQMVESLDDESNSNSSESSFLDRSESESSESEYENLNKATSMSDLNLIDNFNSKFYELSEINWNGIDLDYKHFQIELC